MIPIFPPVQHIVSSTCILRSTETLRRERSAYIHVHFQNNLGCSNWRYAPADLKNAFSVLHFTVLVSAQQCAFYAVSPDWFYYFAAHDSSLSTSSTSFLAFWLCLILGLRQSRRISILLFYSQNFQPPT